MKVLAIPADNASAWTGPTGNNTYLLPDSPAVLIDAGVGHASHIDRVAEAVHSDLLRLVLITHHHIDHSAGAPALRQRWPGLVVRGGDGGEPLRDGETFECGGTRLRAVHTPGHSPDHFCFLDEGSRDLYCGDLVRIGGTVVIPASRGGNLREYLQSLARIRDLAPARLLPAHGPTIEDPAGIIDEYVAHRRMRERQILDALDAGCRTPAEIVARIYADLPPGLVDAAEETVRAHLQKLAEER